jgi:hypothetical protein
MVVPISAESSFFYPTDDSFGRDEYLRRSALASSNLFDPQSSNHSSAQMRSQSVDFSSFNSRTLSRDQQKQRRIQSQRMTTNEPMRTLSADFPSLPHGQDKVGVTIAIKEERMKPSSPPSLKTPLLSATETLDTQNSLSS